MKFSRVVLFSCFFILSYNSQAGFNSESAFATFSDWYNACEQLPYFRKTGRSFENKPVELTVHEITQTLSAFNAVMKNVLQNTDEWINKKSPENTYFEQPTFKPFAQKLILPIGSEVAFHGDLHGDIHSLIEYLNDLKNKNYLDDNFSITKDNFYLVFLGDYVDRGNFGIEVIYTLLRLKIANPDQVFMVRGNHEDIWVNLEYGFTDEINKKFPQNLHILDKIDNIYNFLPVVLYLGSENNFLQCNHGGMEPGYLPHKLLESPSKISYEWIEGLYRKTNWNNAIVKSAKKPGNMTNEQMKIARQLIKQDINEEKLTPTAVGFLWHDFIIDPDIYINKNDRGFVFGKRLTQTILQASSTENKKIVGVFRAHQHSCKANCNMMELILYGSSRGIGMLWDDENNNESLWHGIVATFNVGPDTPYGRHLHFNFDTYGLLTIGNQFPQDWKLQIINIEDVVPENL